MNLKVESIKLKLEKANAFLSEAPAHMENGFYITVINRLYYSCYHATKALLLTEDLFAKTHSGTANLLQKHFVQTGIFDIEHAAFFSRLMNERNEGDYTDIVAISKEEAEEFIEPAKRYIAYVEKLITRHLERQ